MKKEKKKYSMKNYTQEQKDYIKEHYHNTQTIKIAEDLGIEFEEVSYIAKCQNLKKDDGFKYMRRDNSLTYEQCEFILNNFSTMKTSEIIEKTGTTYEIIKSFASRNKLSKDYGYKERSFTKEQEQYVIDNYSTTQTEEMVGNFNLTHSNIMFIAHKFGLKKDTNTTFFQNSKNGLTIEQKKFIIENYATMKNNKICKELNITKDQLHSYARNRKLTKTPLASKRYVDYYDELINKRNRETYSVYNFLEKNKEPKVTEECLYKSKYGKYAVNEHYFDNIDNEWKAYWLGFLYADGCNETNKKNGTKNVNRLSISLAKIDKEHLQKFLNSLQAENPIKDFIARLDGKEYKTSKITICNENICKQLNNKGCVPQKSLILKFPTEDIVPKHLIRHFIRGYFDGDGCISINKELKNINFNILGTYDFLYEMQKILIKECGVDETVIRLNGKGNKAYSFAYGGYADVESIYKYLYKDCNVYLQRKLDKFDTLYCLD